MRLLEDHLGVVLLERNRKGLRLTRTGEEIFRRCEQIFAGVSDIEAISDAEKCECLGPLSFGITDSLAHYVLPGVLRSFLETYPKVRPSVFAGSSNLICTEILEDRVEFGIFFSRPEQDLFQISELFRVPFVLVGATQLKRRLTPSSFIISREIDYPKSRPFPVLQMLRRNGIEVSPIVSSNNLDFQKQMVKEGLGVALLPRFMVKDAVHRGTLSIFHPRKDFSYSLILVTRKRKVLSKNALTFLDHFRKETATIL